MVKGSKTIERPEPTKVELLGYFKKAELAFFRAQTCYYEAQATAARCQAEARESGLVPDLDILLGLVGAIEASLKGLKQAEDSYRWAAQEYGRA